MQVKNPPSNQTIGDRLRERRRLSGLTQRALAEKIGLSPGAIGRMESERDYVTSRPAIIALAQALSCDPDWLETGSGNPSGSFKTLGEVDAINRRINRYLGGLPTEIRSAISEHGLASGHYVMMEYLLGAALKTRAPLPDPGEEREFQDILRNWGKKHDRGRAAVMHAISMLELSANALLREHLVAKSTPKQ